MLLQGFGEGLTGELGTLVGVEDIWRTLPECLSRASTQKSASRVFDSRPAPPGGYLSDRFGSIPVLLAVSFFAIPLIYLLSVVPNVVALIALMLAIGIVSSSRMPISKSYITGNTPERCRATVLGLYYFAGTEVSGPLTPVMGILIDRLGFYSSFTVASAVMGAVVVICSFFRRLPPRHPEGEFAYLYRCDKSTIVQNC